MKSTSTHLTFGLILTTLLFTGELFAQNCAIPTNLMASEISTQSAFLSWNDTPGAALYRVRYREVFGNWTRITVSNNSLELTGLNENTTYEFQARAFCLPGRSSWSASGLFTTTGGTACEDPQGLFTLGIGSLQATLTWQMVTGAINYDARIRELGTGSWTNINNINSNLVIAEGLTALSTYEYQVRANCSGGNSDYSDSEVFTTVDNVCVPADNFQVDAVTANTATLSWNAVGGANHYLVRYRELGAPDWLLRDFIGTTFVTLVDLFPGTDFEAQVQVDCTLGLTEFTESIFFSTDQITICEVPQNLTATQISETFATHNWDPVGGALDYTVRRRIAGTTNWTFEVNTAETSLQTFLLTPATTYEFQVEARCVIGSSGFSASAFYTTLAIAPCPTPGNLATSDITDVSAFLNWEDLIDANGYTVQHREVGSASWITTSRNFSNLTLTNLQSATAYEWRVQSNCESIDSEFSDLQTFFTLSAGSCPTPTGLFVLGISDSGATLIWQSVTGADQYNVRYRILGSATWTNQNGVSSNLLVVTGLQIATTYEFQVQSVCSSGISGFSPSDTFTTTGSASNNPVGLQENRGMTSTQAQVSIYPNPVIDHIKVRLSGTPGEKVAIQVFDKQGNSISSSQVTISSSQDTLEIPLQLQKGLYHIVISSSAGIAREKFIQR